MFLEDKVHTYAHTSAHQKAPGWAEPGTFWGRKGSFSSVRKGDTKWSTSSYHAGGGNQPIFPKCDMSFSASPARYFSRMCV